MGLSERKPAIGEVSLERMVRAVEKVRIRLLRAATALEQAKVPYAVVGGNALAAWVARVDETAVRNTQDVDILLRRGDLETAKNALAAAGFVYRHVKGEDMFLTARRRRPGMPCTWFSQAKRSVPSISCRFPTSRTPSGHPSFAC